MQGKMGKEGVELEQSTKYSRAPELLKSGTYSTATDIYALGMLMYEILFRREPFAGEPTEVCIASAFLCASSHTDQSTSGQIRSDHEQMLLSGHCKAVFDPVSEPRG